MDIVVVERLVVNAVAGWCDPARYLAAFVHRPHQRTHMGLVDVGRQPLTLAPSPFVGRQLLAVRRRLDAGERTDFPVERDTGQLQPALHPGLVEDLVPS